MPLYEYQCEECGRTIEVIQKFSDHPLRKCTMCGGRLERLLSAPAIQFKGSGWYITDYSRKNGGSSGDGSSSKGEKETGASESKTSTEAVAAAKDATKGDTTK